MAEQVTYASGRKNAPSIERARPCALLLVAKDAAAFLGISLRKLYELRSTGELPPPVRLSERIVRYRRADLEAYVESLASDSAIPEPAQLVAGKRRARAEAEPA